MFDGRSHKSPRSWWLKTIDVYSLRLEARSAKARRRWGHALSEGSGGGSVSVASAAGGSRGALVCLIVPVSSPTVTWTSTLGVLSSYFFFPL